MNKKKTVYILGAGTSKADNLPLQSELLYQIFSFNPEENIVNNSFMELKVNNTPQKILQYYESFDKQRRILGEFIVDNFSPRPKKNEYNAIMNNYNDRESIQINSLMRAYQIVSEVNVTLEDLFTLFDKIILGHEHFHIYSSKDIELVHYALRLCIIFFLSYKISSNENKIKTVNKIFAEKIFDMRLSSSYREDILSIITMNWDTILEKEIYKLCQEYNQIKGKRNKIYPDLCFYDDLYDESDPRIVSTHIKAKGHRNIKLLKLHGSINWLVCPYCGRVYVDYNMDIALNEFSENCSCPKCNIRITESESPRMHSIIITPTFLKDLNSLHLKNIWHNALLDITEATKIVFIGYSFPDADFEMRCLLKKAVQPGTEIEIVLYNTDNPKTYQDIMKNHLFSADEVDKFVEKLNLPEKRYKAFFGNESIKLHYCGLKEYIQMEKN
jgi:NAD-dependent SIR2 family protein deacetylase